MAQVPYPLNAPNGCGKWKDSKNQYCERMNDDSGPVLLSGLVDRI